MASRAPVTADKPLSPPFPPPRINTEDASSGQDISDNSDDHFSSASEGATPKINAEDSPIPITRVERVDDSALHGEVPGTPAYDLRAQDAVPDEIEIVPEGRPRSATNTTRGRALSQLSVGSARSDTPGGSPIPRTVVEKVDFKPSHGEVEGTPAKEMRMADALPDEVREAPDQAGMRLQGRIAQANGSQAGEEEVNEEEDEEGRQRWFRSMWEGQADDRPKQEMPNEKDYDEDEDDDFGDDFDEFAEGGGDDDFGDFDEAEEEPPQPQASSQPPPPDILADLPPLDLSCCNSKEEITAQITPYINAMLPDSQPLPSKYDLPPLDATTTPAFSSERSLSLWQQLVSPPPMQPPNWTRSRIRRLFLVSLGVPVDLDEILPPSKQKRLILPSIGLEGGEGGRRGSHAAVERLRSDGANDSSTSLDSKTGQPKPRSTKAKKSSSTRPGPPPPPAFDSISALRLAATTSEALAGFEDEELREHVVRLEVGNNEASRVLEYWLQRRDEGWKEKEALEGVVGNLVGFVKGRRGK